MREKVLKESFFLSQPERRNYRRLDVNLDVDLVIEGQRVNAITENVSCGGLFFPSKNATPFKQNSNVEVTLSLPDTKNPVKIIGEVSRCPILPPLPAQKNGVAIRFRGLYDENILALDRFIKNKMH